MAIEIKVPVLPESVADASIATWHVKPGDVVEQGDVIAQIGATGRVTGPHLDWRINWFNVRLDPALVLDTLDD